MSLKELQEEMDNLPTVPKSIFMKHLPALINPEANEEERRQWLKYCLDPRLSVNVVDDETGEVLHRVPPMIYTSDTLTGRNVAGMLKDIAEMTENNPLAARGIANQLITPDLIKGEPPEEDVLLWEQILRDYKVDEDGKVTDQSDQIVDSGALADDPDSW